MKKFIHVVCLLFVVSSAATVWPQEREKVDLETTGRIRYEGFHNSKVMDYATGLMDSIGERLTGSPNMKRANEWTRDQLTAMGLSNAHLEPWGPFGRGWANQYVNVRMTSPDVVTLLAYPKAWTPGTNGVVQGKCIRATIDDKKDFDKYKGKLAGMIVILGADAEVKPITEAPYKRLSDDDLAKMADYQIPGDHPPFGFAAFVKRQQFVKDLNQFFADEKVLAVIDHSRQTSGGGTVFVQSGGSYKPGETTTIPQLTIALEQWTRIARLLQQNEAVASIFEAWMKPFKDLGMNTLTMRNTGGTDHLSFDAVGIPGFQFIQDPIEYETRTHHSNMDVYDRLQPDDLKQMAVIVAGFVYDAAMRDQMLPRKPIEKALPREPEKKEE